MDGIGHYSAFLAEVLAGSHRVSVLLGSQEEKPTPIAGVESAMVFSAAEPRSVWEVVRQVERRRPDWVVLQYNPFSYGRWGYNPYLPKAARAFKRCSPGTRFALMIHEPFVPRSNWKFVMMSIWQRRQLRLLGAAADVVFTSIDPWAKRFRPWFPGKSVVHLPVGSNIPLIPTTAAQARACLGIQEQTVTLGLFGTAAAARLLDLVREAAQALQKQRYVVQVIYLGPHAKQVRAALGDLPVIAPGPLPAEEVSRRLPAIDIFLSPFIDGISTRRSSMMTALQHGLPVVGTRGEWTDDLLLALDGEAFLLSDVEDRSGYIGHVLNLVQDRDLGARLGAQARCLFAERFDWDRIAARMVTTLQNVERAL
jgi:glycosyltransferase involved in cell wall biosynthesis